MGNLDVVEQQESIIHSVVAELGANISNMDIGHGFVGFEVADLDHEWMGTV